MAIADDLKARTFKFSVDVYRLCARHRFEHAAAVIRTQLIKASSSTAANYRAACRGRSRPEFIAKIGTAIEEADESLFWLYYVEATRILPASPELHRLRTEANELVSIFTTSHKTATENEERAKREKCANRRRRARRNKKE
jgi:four helix bundle protein